MITIGKYRIRSYMTMEYEFSGIRVLESELIPVHWKLTVNLVPSQKKRKNLEELARNADIAYQRIYFWAESILNNVIIVDTANTLGIAIGASIENILMMCPGTPSDEVITELLHSKFTALANGNMLVGEIHLSGDDCTASHSYNCPDGMYSLPLTVSEYISVPSKYTKPWWSRNDGFCFEFLKPLEHKDKSDEEYFGTIEDPMTEFDSTMDDIVNTGLAVPHEQATIIQVEKWKPRKV